MLHCVRACEGRTILYWVNVIFPAVMQSNLWNAYYSVTCKASSITAVTASRMLHLFQPSSSPSLYHFPAMHPEHFAVEYCFSSPLSPLPVNPPLHPCITTTTTATTSHRHFLFLIRLNCGQKLKQSDSFYGRVTACKHRQSEKRKVWKKDGAPRVPTGHNAAVMRQQNMVITADTLPRWHYNHGCKLHNDYLKLRGHRNDVQMPSVVRAPQELDGLFFSRSSRLTSNVIICCGESRRSQREFSARRFEKRDDVMEGECEIKQRHRNNIPIHTLRCTCSL